MAVKIIGTRRNSIGMIIFTGAVFVILVVLSVLGVIQYNRMKSDYKKQLAEYSAKVNNYENQLAQSTKIVYVPREDLKYNTVIEEYMFDITEILSSLPQSEYIDQNDFGKILRADIKAQTPLMKYMVQDHIITDDLRSVEFNTLTLQTNIKKNDFVDVRIRFPNGEDYIVLSKKMVNDIKLNTSTVWLSLDQKEMMTMSSATVDAYLRKGTKLYAVKYVQPQTQKAAVTTYPFNADVQKVMMADPNIVEKASIALAAQARMDLEARINIIPQEVLNTINSGVEKENSELKKTIQEIQKEQNSKANTTNTEKSNPTEKTQSNSGQTSSQSSGQVTNSGTRIDSGDDGGSSLDNVLN